MNNLLFSFLKYFIYLFLYREGKGERKRGRETLMWERNIHQLTFVCPQQGTYCAAQASATSEPNQWPAWEQSLIHGATPSPLFLFLHISLTHIPLNHGMQILWKMPFISNEDYHHNCSCILWMLSNPQRLSANPILQMRKLKLRAVK